MMHSGKNLNRPLAARRGWRLVNVQDATKDYVPSGILYIHIFVRLCLCRVSSAFVWLRWLFMGILQYLSLSLSLSVLILLALFRTVSSVSFSLLIFDCFLWLSFSESSGLCFYLEHSFTVARNFACSIFQKSAARPVVKPYGSI